MTRRVEFNDGEGLDPTDLNMMAKLVERNLGVMHGPRLWPGAGLRLLSGVDFALSGTEKRTVTLTAGKYLIPATPATEDDPSYRVGDYAGGAFTLDARTSSGVWRRDIIQAKVDTEAAGTATSRDFEDAASRVITTTSPNKRRLCTATLSVKKGVDQASNALADANEPAPDAGFTKVYSFLVPATGGFFGDDMSEIQTWDWHAPLGGGHAVSTPDNSTLKETGGASVGLAGTGTGWEIYSGDARIVSHFPPGFSTGVGMRIHTVHSFLTTHGDVNFDFALRVHVGGFAFTDIDWGTIIGEGQTNIARSLVLPHPVWSSGYKNRQLPNPLSRPPYLTWRVEDSSATNYWSYFGWEYYGT